MEDLINAMAGLNAVAVKVPSFWKHQARLWFIRLEAEFQAANITLQATRFSHVVRNLTEEAAVEVKHILENPPTDNRYDVLKAAFIKAFEPTTAARLQQFHALSLGDLRPSQLLRSMRDLNNQGLDTEMYKEHFLAKLPASVQLHLSIIPGTIEELADQADLLVDRLRQQPAGAISAMSPNHLGDEALQAEVDAVYRRFGRLPPGSSRNRDQPQQQQQQQKTPEFCFFHQRYGAKAKKCSPPCSWKPQGKASGL